MLRKVGKNNWKGYLELGFFEDLGIYVAYGGTHTFVVLCVAPWQRYHRWHCVFTSTWVAKVRPARLLADIMFWLAFLQGNQKTSRGSGSTMTSTQSTGSETSPRTACGIGTSSRSGRTRYGTWSKGHTTPGQDGSASCSSDFSQVRGSIFPVSHGENREARF